MMNRIQMSADERYVWLIVCPQTFSGMLVSGVFFGWGALSESINAVFNPDDPLAFKNNHGTFTAVIILSLNTIPMYLLRLVLDRKYMNEFQSQLLGTILITFGMFMGGVALQFKILPMLYILCAVPCGFGGMMTFQRIAIIHQMWFKKIDRANVGAGVIGFSIGMWATLLCLLSVPIQTAMPIHSVFYIYGTFIPICMFAPLVFGKDVDPSTLHKRGLVTRGSFHSAVDLHPVLVPPPVLADPAAAIEGGTNTHLLGSVRTNNVNSTYAGEINDYQLSPEKRVYAGGGGDDNNIYYESSNKTRDKTDTGHNNQLSLKVQRQSYNELTNAPNKISVKLESGGFVGTIAYSGEVVVEGADTQIARRRSAKEATSSSIKNSTTDYSSINHSNNNNNTNDNRNITSSDDSIGREKGRNSGKVSTSRGSTCDRCFGFRLFHRYVNEPIPITDQHALEVAHEMGIYIDEFGMFQLTNQEILEHPMTWVLTLFFVVVVTPGWGIKLGTVVILNAMFNAPQAFAAQMTAIYMAIYAVGRLVGGYLAQYVGSFIAFDILVLTMLVFLAVSPLTGLYMDHGSSDSAGCKTFMVFICVVGLVYGGAVALFYSIIFDVFGALNYKAAFQIVVFGLGAAVIIGGVSAAASFSESSHHNASTISSSSGSTGISGSSGGSSGGGSGNGSGGDSSNIDVSTVTSAVTGAGAETGIMAANWFYAMAGLTAIGLFLLHILKPVDFNRVLEKRIRAQNSNRVTATDGDRERERERGRVKERSSQSRTVEPGFSRQVVPLDVDSAA